MSVCNMVQILDDYCCSRGNVGLCRKNILLYPCEMENFLCLLHLRGCRGLYGKIVFSDPCFIKMVGPGNEFFHKGPRMGKTEEFLGFSELKWVLEEIFSI